VNTLKPSFFEEEISAAYDCRLDRKALAKDQFIEIQSGLLDLIANSRHMSKGTLVSPSLIILTNHLLATRGRGVQILNKHSQKRTRKQFD
jgi:hypothetical protein